MRLLLEGVEPLVLKIALIAKSIRLIRAVGKKGAILTSESSHRLLQGLALVVDQS